MKEYNYTQPGAYFVTICTHDHEYWLGEIQNSKMILNKFSEIVREEWCKSSRIRGEIEMDEFVVMPNHIHGIVIITATVGATGRSPLPGKPIGPRPKSLGAFVAGFKSAVTRQINILRNTPGKPFWQRNYYEHIIRGDNSLNKIREYIMYNVMCWQFDPVNRQ